MLYTQEGNKQQIVSARDPKTRLEEDLKMNRVFRRRPDIFK